jgi:hypothetical protein
MFFLYAGISLTFVLLVYLVCMALVRHEEKKEERRRTRTTTGPSRT